MVKGIRSIIFIIWIVSSVISFSVMADTVETGVDVTEVTEVAEETNLLFSINDPVGDDWGPGTYTYPTFKHFEPYRGLYDLTQFTIRDLDTDYLLEFTFDEIRDPWRSKYGFSHPLLQLYIDNQPGGDTSLFRQGARVSLDPETEWDQLLNITGWWVRAFRPTDREEVESMKIFWDDTKNPFDLEAAIVKTEGNLIKVQLPKEVVGDLEKAKFILLVGAFDSFGHDYFREIKETKNDWYFGGNSQGELGPRVIDLLVPEDYVQEEVLMPREDGLVILPYISLREDPVEIIVESDWGKFVVWGSALVILGLLALIVRFKTKRPPMSQ